MKVRALRNIDGVVKAYAGQEFEITSELMIRDLMQQGVITPVTIDGMEAQSVMNKDTEQLAKEAEIEAIRRAEYEKAYSGAIQKEVNMQTDQLQEEQNQIKQEAMTTAEQDAKQAFEQTASMNTTPVNFTEDGKTF